MLKCSLKIKEKVSKLTYSTLPSYLTMIHIMNGKVWIKYTKYLDKKQNSQKNFLQICTSILLSLTTEIFKKMFKRAEISRKMMVSEFRNFVVHCNMHIYNYLKPVFCNLTHCFLP